MRTVAPLSTMLEKTAALFHANGTSAEGANLGRRYFLDECGKCCDSSRLGEHKVGNGSSRVLG